jgi:hypothetical protein
MTFFALGVDSSMGREAVRSDNDNDRASLPVLLMRDKFIKDKFQEEYCNG